jgi:hypothetical protein
MRAKYFVKIFFCILAAFWSAALLTIETLKGTGSVTDTAIHVSVILIAAGFAWGKPFFDNAREYTNVVVNVLPFDVKLDGKRKYDPKTAEHPAAKPPTPVIEKPPAGAGDV